MNRSSADRNLKSLTLIAYRLEELCEDVTFVGGSVIGLLITDKAAPDVRFTIDVDCVINVITHAKYYVLAEKLRQKGFKEMPFGNNPICRWDCDGVLLDVVPTDKNILGFSNKWYKDAVSNAIRTKVNDAISINIISAPYFLATKLEAFKDRGNQDFLLSHDLEDIISLIDGRIEILDDVSGAADTVIQYLSEEFALILSNDLFLGALPGHLNYSKELDVRKNIVLERMQAIIDLG